jgi:hypothetical protein
MAKKKNTRPALVINCESTEDHAKHAWTPEGADWPEGVFWHCRGYNRAEAAAGVQATARAIKKARKKH